MKKVILLTFFCLAGLFSANAQKFALIDMEYIMERIPSYGRATAQLEQLSKQYQQTIENKAKEAKNLYQAYQKSSASMSASQRNQKEEAIIAKEKEVADLKNQYFGQEGAMAKKQEELILPIQNQVYEAVKRISLQRGYDAVLDRATATSLIFASPKIDISDEVLRLLGYSK